MNDGDDVVLIRGSSDPDATKVMTRYQHPTFAQPASQQQPIQNNS